VFFFSISYRTKFLIENKGRGCYCSHNTSVVCCVITGCRKS